MLKIRVKGKYIVLSLAVFLLLSGTVCAAAPSILSARADALAERGKAELSARYYGLLLSCFPRSPEAVQALFFTAQREAGTSGGADAGYINIFPSSLWGAHLSRSPEQLESAIAQFELVRERCPASPWARHALHEIGQAYYNLGEYDKAVEYLKLSIEASEMAKAESTKLLAEIYRTRGDSESALALVSRSLEERPHCDALGLRRLKGRILLDLGRFDAARAEFAALPEMAEKLFGEMPADEEPDWKAENSVHWEDLAARYIQYIDRLSRADGKTGTITGRVVLGGSGLAGARVYLIDREFYGDYNTSDTEDLPQVLTGADGSFTFAGLAPGQYDLGVGVRAEDLAGSTLRQNKEAVPVEAGKTAQRDLEFTPAARLVSPLAGVVVGNNVTFVWEPVAGAVRYDLFWGPATRQSDGSVTSPYTSVWRFGIEGCTVTMDLAAAAARDRFTGVIAYDQDGIDPLSVLGPLYAGGEFTWGVYAYDAAGSRINDSLGYGLIVRGDEIPFFTLAGQTPSEADRLLLARNYEAAVAEYEKTLEQNPRDTNSLLVLARLYHLGRRMEEADPARAAAYYERFLALEDVPEARQALAECYFRLGKDKEAYAEYAALASDDPDNWFYRYQMAKIKFIGGEPENALALLRETLTLPGGEYVRAYPVAVALLLEEGRAALDFARQVDGGADYLPLLRDYLARGRRLPTAAAQAIRAGDYGRALAALGAGSHERFCAALLNYANSRQWDYHDLRRLAGAVEAEEPAQLLRRMVNIGW